MGSLKDQALKNDNEDVQLHELTDREMSLLKLLWQTLTYHLYRQQIMSAFLQYIAFSRLGYTEGENLQFEMDFDKDDNKLAVKLLPATENGDQ